MILVYTDGSITGGSWASKKAAPSLPHAWSGWVVRRGDGTWIAHHSFDLGEGPEMSANVAEHFAVNSALRWLIQNGYQSENVVVYTDSQLAVGHLTGTFQIHKENLKKIARATLALMAHFPSVKMKWIRREENKYADAMSKIYQEKFFHIFGGKIPKEELTAEFLAKWR